jgi:hypothetical protein
MSNASVIAFMTAPTMRQATTANNGFSFRLGQVGLALACDVIAK